MDHHLQAFGRLLLTDEAPAPRVEPADRQAFQRRVWVTRPKPHVDRLASVWLIRRFIDPEATVRYRAAALEDEVSFDMPEARFGHTGPLCTFETLLAAFALDDPALQVLAEIVHEIDLRDGRYARPEAAGLEAILDGWREMDLADQELEWRGTALFEGLYTAVARHREATPVPEAARRTAQES